MSNEQLHITVYTTGACTYCQQQKQFLQEHNLPFEEILIDDVESAEAMIKRSGQMNVPFTIIKRPRYIDEISGFDKVRLRKALGI